MASCLVLSVIYDEFRNFFIVLLSAIMLSVIMLSVIVLSVIVLSVIVLSVIMLSVAALWIWCLSFKPLNDRKKFLQNLWLSL